MKYISGFQDPSMEGSVFDKYETPSNSLDVAWTRRGHTSAGMLLIGYFMKQYMY